MFFSPLKMLSSPLRENPKMPISPSKRKLSTCTSATTSSCRNAMMASISAASMPTSGSKIPPKSNPPPPSPPLGIARLALPHRADRAQGVHALLRLRVHVLLGEVLARSGEEERPVIAHHVRHFGERPRRQCGRVDPGHILYLDDLHKWIHGSLLFAEQPSVRRALQRNADWNAAAATAAASGQR